MGRNQKGAARRVALLGVLFALAAVLSLFEGALAGAMGLPPGVKPGLANTVVMFALLFLGLPPAACLAVLKALLALLEDTTYRASLQNLLPPSSSHSADHVTAMAAFALGDELVTVHADYPGKVWISPAHSRTLAFSISARELNETLADFIQQHGAAGDP